MTYQPLATKYRPTRFSELVGQEVAARALANAIQMGRAPRQLIFTGVRGIGKTTVSRLYAKALNCEHRGDGAEPCSVCESCVAIARGHHEDVLEIDGASNTGVNDVRALQETIDYRPQRSTFKVYVIDEVHMLSQAAFNALLKTLEELPPHAVFVFATTEINKVPATILSRCQTFYLKKLPTPLILGRLQEILAKEGIRAEDKALAAVAREGHGSMRDALTLLDQAISLGHGEVTAQSLGRVAASLSSTASLELLAALVARDAGRALAVVQALDEAGIEFERAAEAAAELARHAFVAQGLGIKALDLALLGLDDGELATLRQIAEAAGPLDLNRIFRTLVKCRGELDGSALDRYVFENYLFEWCFDPGFPDVGALLGDGGAPPPPEMTKPPQGAGVSTGAKRVGSMRAVMDEIKAGTGAHPSPPPQPAASPAATSMTEPTPRPRAGAAAMPAPPAASGSAPEASRFPPSWRQLVDGWKQQKPLQARKLEEAHPLEYSPSRIVLAVREDSYASRGLLLKEEQSRIAGAFRELFGFQGVLVVQPHTTTVAAAAALPETILAERSREADDRRRRVLDEARDAPFTRDLLAALGGTLEDVRLPEDGRS